MSAHDIITSSYCSRVMTDISLFFFELFWVPRTLSLYTRLVWVLTVLSKVSTVMMLWLPQNGLIKKITPKDMIKIHKNKIYDAITATELIDNHRQKNTPKEMIQIHRQVKLLETKRICITNQIANFSNKVIITFTYLKYFSTPSIISVGLELYISWSLWRYASRERWADEPFTLYINNIKLRIHKRNL